MTNEERIHANAAKVIQTFSDQDLAFDKRSVEWLDGYIERNRESWDEPTSSTLGNVLGSFLGECVRQNFGGTWQMTENGLAVVFATGNAVFPFNKINKHIANGADDSIGAFYNSIAAIFSSADDH